jgi:hypothetical protein
MYTEQTASLDRTDEDDEGSHGAGSDFDYQDYLAANRSPSVSVGNPDHAASSRPGPGPELSQTEQFCSSSVQHFMQCDVRGGKIPQETQERFNNMLRYRSQDPSNDEIQAFVMSAEEVENDPRILREGKLGISRTFYSQSEFELFRFNTQSRHSVLNSNQLLALVTKVKLAYSCPGCDAYFEMSIYILVIYCIPMYTI